MKAMILAAGQGTRFRPFTYEIPKPMIPVLGRPVLEYLLEHLAAHGVREVMINTSHHGDRIERHFGDGRRFGLEIGYSFEGRIEDGRVIAQPLGSAGGMRKIEDFGGFFDQTTLVLCADAIIDLDLGAALVEHRARGASATLAATRVPPGRVSDYGVVVADGDGRILSFQEKPAAAEAKSNWVNTGVYLFEPEVLDLVPSGGVCDIAAQLFPRLIEQGYPFYAHRADFHWLDLGRTSDYWAVMQRALREEVPGLRLPGRRLRDRLHVGLNTDLHLESLRAEGPVYIGSGTRIERGCTLVGPSWIGHGCHLQAGTRIERSVVFEHTRVAAGSTVREQMLYGDFAVSRDGGVARRGEPALPLVWSDARAPLEIAA